MSFQWYIIELVPVVHSVGFNEFQYIIELHSVGFNEFPVVHNSYILWVLMSFQWYIIELHSVGFNEFPVVHNRVTFCGF